MKYLIETSYPENKGLFAKKVFTPGWYGGSPYFKMGWPYTDNIGTQHVDLYVQLADDDGINGNRIGKAHIPSGMTLITHDDLETVSDAIEAGDTEKALELLKVMSKENRCRYQARKKYRLPEKT
jgi:hypothetical protein